MSSLTFLVRDNNRIAPSTLKARTEALVGPICDKGSSSFTEINECVPEAIVADPVFLSSFRVAKTCHGGLISTTAALEALRFCNIIDSELIVDVDDTMADFTSLHDITSIAGLSFVRNRDLPLSHVIPGPLVIRNSSMTTLTSFANLEDINSGLAPGFDVDGKSFSLVVTGS